MPGKVKYDQLQIGCKIPTTKEVPLNPNDLLAGVFKVFYYLSESN